MNSWHVRDDIHHDMYYFIRVGTVLLMHSCQSVVQKPQLECVSSPQSLLHKSNKIYNVKHYWVALPSNQISLYCHWHSWYFELQVQTNGNQVLLTHVFNWFWQRYTPTHSPRYSSSTILFAKQLILSSALGLGYVWPSEPHTGSKFAVITMGHTHSALPPTTLHWWYGCVHRPGSAQGSVKKGTVITFKTN